MKREGEIQQRPSLYFLSVSLCHEEGGRNSAKTLPLFFTLYPLSRSLFREEGGTLETCQRR
jgi:hypothetical protein